jgi:two-component system NtrC family response regulator
MAEHKILIVDDEEWIRNQLKWALSKDYEVLQTGDVDSVGNIISQEKPDLIMLDISLTPNMGVGTEGITLLQDILGLDSTIKVIMITGNDTRENARKCVALGAYDFYSKPIDMEEMKISIKRALHIQSLERENKRLLEDLERAQEFREIISSCEQMEEVLDTVRRVSTTDETVLIQGDSGTGKELVARAIHYNNSSRKDKPFVPVNCGAIPENLLESELFGHEKGAFTDAHVQRKGKLELAENGTVFLDEIAELALTLQVKILRFLQEREIERVGGGERIHLNVRVLAATNRALEEEIKKGTFREDLYYRLNVISVYLPPLRERGEDVVLLANAFLARFGRDMKTNINGFNDEALAALRSHDWPGNVRELENKVRRAIIMARNTYITPDDLDLLSSKRQLLKQPGRLTPKEARDQLELGYIIEALRRSNGNVTHAAEQLGITRGTFYNLMKKYGVDAEEYEADHEA